MANTSKKKKTEPITNCDQSIEVIANCDNMSINIESLIHTFRGQKVMLDFDLAMLYGVQTKALNQAVKRNIKRFPDDFMFQMTKEELDSLRSQIATANPAGHHNIEEWRSQFVTSNFTRMGLRRPPYAFTRNGIGMLSSVLRSETAVEVNIRDQGDRSLIFYFERGRDGESSRGKRHLGISKQNLSP